MERNAAFGKLIDRLSEFNTEGGFNVYREKGVKQDESPVSEEDGRYYVMFQGERGAYRLALEEDKNLLVLEYPDDSGESWKSAAKMLFELDRAEDRDVRSTANEVQEELVTLFRKNDKMALDKIKMPKTVSKSAVKNGGVNYDVVDLASRYADAFPELKDGAKQIIQNYGELLPETFFVEYGTPHAMSVIKNRNEQQLKKLFRLLNEVYENGTNAAQDMIAVTILGAMQNEEAMMATADSYMSDYMRPPVQEINKLLSKPGKLSKQLETPPPYKPKKQKKPSRMSTLMNQQPPQN
ncbi:MAG: hypothetical protein LIO46_03395 [Clostridiales bacterium]|nr:hypothetical protein [Clostridiales bacterium]